MAGLGSEAREGRMDGWIEARKEVGGREEGEVQVTNKT